jgi:hypothetical protein
MKGKIMTAPGSQAGNRPRPRTHEEAAQRAAAGFLDSSGVRDGVTIMGYAGRFHIRVAVPYFDAAARQAVVTRVAGLIGGTVRQEDDRDFPMADLVAEGAVGGLQAKVSTGVHAQWTGPRTGNGQPLAEAPGGQVTAVPGKLPDGWRWVTELDPEPTPAAPRNQRSAAPVLPSAEAPALAARDCPPLTSAALRAAARQEQAATGQPARNGARPARRRHSRGGS